MDKVILQGILIAVSIFEIWLCYQVLFMTVIEKSCLRIIDKCIMWGNIIILGTVLGINRRIVFFSNNMFIVGVVITYLSVKVIQKKRVNVAIIVFCYSVIALLDLYFCYVSIPVIGENFFYSMYWETLSAKKCYIYIASRIIIYIGILVVERKKNIKFIISEFQNFLWMINLLCIVLIVQYQQILVSIAFGKDSINAERTGISLLLIIVIFSFIGLLLLKYRIMENENKFLILQDKMMEQNYQEIEKERENNRKVIHDIKNHFLVLKTYEQEKNYDGIHNYLEEIETGFNQYSVQRWTGNKIIDLILNQKKSQAEQMGIIFEIQAVPVQKWLMKDSELCSFWGNLLDNAIEACNIIENKNKWITVVIKQQKSLLFINIKNSIKNIPTVRNGKLISIKKNSKEHGYGLRNVERIVYKYNGVISYLSEKGMFYVQVSFFY